VTGDFCSPLCVQNECPKGDGSFTAKPSCVLETQGSSKPTQCALICTPGSNGACPAGATCQAIQGEGICTYPSSGAALAAEEKVELLIPTKCAEELTKVCPKGSHTIRNQTGCRQCIEENEAALKAAECNAPEVVTYCEPNACGEALEILCHAEQNNATECESCLKSNLRILEKYQCDKLDDIAFCKSGYVPPPDAACLKELDSLCEAEQGDHEKCTDCEIKNLAALNKAKCDSRDLLTFCTPAANNCRAEISKDCGAERAQGTAQCDTCVKAKSADLQKAGCTTTDEIHFCGN
jgi:hypothetical protein